MSVLDPVNHADNTESEWTQSVQAAFKAKGNAQTAQEFGQGLVSEEFLSGDALVEKSGDNVTTVPLAYSTDYAHRFGTFYPSGYRDDRVQRTHREKLYMGMPQNSW
jgi:hypothetical protein